MSQSHIQTTVMRRVYFIHAVQPLLTTTVTSVVLFVIALWSVGREVWVERVFRNMPSPTNIAAVLHFYFAAFMDTRFIVQVLSVIVVATFVWFTVSIARMMANIAQFA